ncbi:hypothetical protein BJV77DRAFT_1030846 [Russula vinacea]|nr:hypothetical protein BJV77DRAFT_1030846 [Russula vinacea]
MNETPRRPLVVFAFNGTHIIPTDNSPRRKIYPNLLPGNVCSHVIFFLMLVKI